MSTIDRQLSLACAPDALRAEWDEMLDEQFDVAETGYEAEQEALCCHDEPVYPTGYRDQCVGANRRRQALEAALDTFGERIASDPAFAPVLAAWAWVADAEKAILAIQPSRRWTDQRGFVVKEWDFVAVRAANDNLRAANQAFCGALAAWKAA